MSRWNSKILAYLRRDIWFSRNGSIWKHTPLRRLLYLDLVVQYQRYIGMNRCRSARRVRAITGFLILSVSRSRYIFCLRQRPGSLIVVRTVVEGNPRLSILNVGLSRYLVLALSDVAFFDTWTCNFGPILSHQMPID